jgi:hypothetical protein
MKRLLLFLLLVVAVSNANATTYYVDCNANGDAGAGTGTGVAVAWKTISKVNSSSFSAGDSVLFNKGCTWREQLTIPSSGSAGNPITFGAYGSGAAPIIDGSDLITPGTSWGSTIAGGVTWNNMRISAVAGTAFVDFSSAGTLTPYLNARLTVTDSAGKKLIGYIKAAGTGETLDSEVLPNTAFDNTTNVSAYLGAVASVGGGQAGNALEVTTGGSGAASGLETATVVSGGMYKSTIYVKKGTGTTFAVYLRQNGGSYANWHSISGNAPAGWTLYSIYGTTDLASLMYAMEGDSSAGTTELFDTASVKQVLTPSTTGVWITSTAGGSTYNWTSEDSGFNRNDSSGFSYEIDSATANVWRATVTTQPNLVFFDGVLGALVGSPAAVVSVGQWYWAANVLHIYSTSDPDTAYTSPGIEVGVRDSALVISTKNYLTFDGLQFRRGNNSNSGTITNDGYGNVYSGVEVAYGVGNGIQFTGTSKANRIVSSSIHHTKYGVLAWEDSSDANSVNYVRDSSIYNNANFGVYINANYWIIENNTLYDNGNSAYTNVVGINFCDFQSLGYGQHGVARYNHVYGTRGGSDSGTGIEADFGSRYIDIYYNILNSNGGSGLIIYKANDVNIFNNVLYGNAQDYYTTHSSFTEISVLSDAPGTTSNIVLKNNIARATVANGYAIQFDANTYNGTGLSVTNNDWFTAATNWYFWNATGGNNLATWNGLTGVGTDLNSDPLFVSASDFHLQAGSPAINAGFSLGFTTDFEGNTIKGEPDIGAYESNSSVPFSNTLILQSPLSPVSGNIRFLP